MYAIRSYYVHRHENARQRGDDHQDHHPLQVDRVAHDPAQQRLLPGDGLSGEAVDDQLAEPAVLGRIHVHHPALARVLEVDYHGVRAAGERLGDALRAVAGNEQSYNFV